MTKTLTVHNTPWVKDWADHLATNPPKTTGTLTRTGVGSCCLGVLCEVQGIEVLSQRAMVTYGYGNTDGMDLPPQALTEALLGSRFQDFALHGFVEEVERIAGYADSTRFTNHLPTINDHYGLTHAQHGDLIRYFGLQSSIIEEGS